MMSGHDRHLRYGQIKSIAGEEVKDLRRQRDRRTKTLTYLSMKIYMSVKREYIEYGICQVVLARRSLWVF